MKRSAFLVFLAGVVVMTGSFPADARVPNRTPRRRLEGSVSSALGQQAARGATPGILIQRGGATLVAVNPDRPMIPASLTKLATTTAAILRFGPAHRFATRVVAGSAPRNGVVRELVLVGGGDPAFVTEAYGRRRFLPQPRDPIPAPAFPGGYATVEALAEAVYGAGIRSVTGALVVDETRFDTIRTLPGWLPEYRKTGSVEVGTLSALAVDEGFTDQEQKNAAADPAMRAGQLLRAALASRGVSFGGQIRHGSAPAKPVQIARVQSPPLSEIVGYTNRYSVNFSAELMLKSLGASFGGAGTAPAGINVVMDTLRRARVPVEGMELYDGSGLSLRNRITPRTVAALLQRALADATPGGEALRASMAVAGAPGTLLRRLRQPPAVGNVRGKTGLVRRVRAMAGWVKSQDGTTLVYVSLFNDAAGSRQLAGPIDAIAFALSLFPYG